MFYHGFFLSFFRQLPSELAEQNSVKTGHMLGSECDMKMHVRNAIIVHVPEPSSYWSCGHYCKEDEAEKAKNTFSTTSQLNGNSNGL